MKKDDIEVGETYLFVGSESPKRKHLAGQPFTVTSKDRVFRKLSYRKGKRLMKVTRFFNDAGVGARAEELEPLPINEFYKCPECKGICKLSELQHEGDDEQGQSLCPECGTVVSPETPPANPF